MYNLLLLVVMSNISISPNTDMWNVVYRLYIIILYYVIVMIIHICSYSCFIVDVLLTSMFWFGSIDNTLCVLLSMLNIPIRVISILLKEEDLLVMLYSSIQNIFGKQLGICLCLVHILVI